MIDKIEKKRLIILNLLREANQPLAGNKITEQLAKLGYNISERTIRFHLLALDKLGYTKYIGRKGRQITPQGLLELQKARVFEKVGFFTGKIDQMTYRMTFDLSTLEGTVVVNVSLIEKKHLKQACPLMKEVFKAGYAMGEYITIFDTGQNVGDLFIPADYVGIGTVCSITLNGVLLQHGIPTHSRFGGLLEIVDGKPRRFVAIINYDGTSLDPLEIFIKSGMTDYIGATTSGSGQIGASFREMPAVSREEVVAIAQKLKKIGLGGFMEVGWPGQSLLEIPIDQERVGAIVIGGLNPVAILEEYGMDVYSHALSGLIEFKQMFRYQELDDRIKGIV